MTVSGTGNSARPGPPAEQSTDPQQSGAAAGAGAPTLLNAAAWNKWFPLFERAARPLTQRMITLAGIGVGARVLDVGTGIGEPALSAAVHVGRAGHVTGIDPDPEMIALARNQAAERGIGNVEFIVARAEELDFAPRSFDAILCRWSLMFVDDLEACLSRLRPLLRPGGHLVAATWGPPERAPALSLARWTIHRHLGRTPPPQGAKTAFALSDADRLLETFRAAGFLKASQEWLPVAFEFHDMIEYLECRTDCTGSLFSGVGEITAAQRQGALGAIETALAPYRGPDGRITLVSHSCCTTARATGH